MWMVGVALEKCGWLRTLKVPNLEVVVVEGLAWVSHACQDGRQAADADTFGDASVAQRGAPRVCCQGCFAVAHLQRLRHPHLGHPQTTYSRRGDRTPMLLGDTDRRWGLGPRRHCSSLDCSYLPLAAPLPVGSVGVIRIRCDRQQIADGDAMGSPSAAQLGVPLACR